MTDCEERIVPPITPPVDPGGGEPVECDCDSLNRAIAAKQDRLIAGTGITIVGSVISSTGGGGGGTAGVASFKGRTGTVQPQVGDYSAALIRANDGKTVQEYINEYNNNQPDTAMSASSTKAVQNKVIKAYVDAVDRKTLPAGGAAGDLLAKIDGTNYNAQWVSGNNFMKKTDYDRNNNGKVDKAEDADALVYGSYKASAPALNGNTTVLVQSQVNKNNGVAGLDNNGKILPSMLPDNIMNGLTYGGVFDAQTRVVRLTPAAKDILGITADTMTLQNSSQVPEGYPANAELFYVTTRGGNFAGMDFSNGDWLISLATEWQQLKNGSQVSSVNGQTGAVDLISDDVPEGTTNLYMTAAEKTKLANIEAEATKDTDVIQTASVTQLSDGTKVLRLVNKNGTVTTFEGNAAIGDYLTRTGNASSTYLLYTPTGERTSFTGGEQTGEFARKVVDWLRKLETVAFTGDYNDLKNVPTKLSQFMNDGDGTNQFVTRTTANLLNYYLKTEVYTQQEVDDLLASVGSMNFIVVNSLPVTDIDTSAIYYVPVDAQDPSKGYNRYQYIRGRWIFLGTTDVDLSNYLQKTGDGSNVTSTLSVYTSRRLLQANETLKESFGKINKWLTDLKEIAFTASWRDLTDADELALKTDLDDYVEKQWPLTEAGKVLALDNDGKVTTASVGDTVVRKGDGFRSVIGNDHPDAKINDADGEYAAAFGFHTDAAADKQFVFGEYNRRDSAGAYYQIVGMGTDEDNRENAYTLNKTGHGNYFNGASAGNTTSHIWTPTNSNDFTTKKYVDEKIAESGNLKKMVVAAVPDVDDALEDVLYLVQDPDDPEVYAQWTKVLVSTNPDVYEMASVGSTKTNLDDYQLKEPGDLDTTDPTVSGAINELLGMIGDLDDLETSVKTSVVEAINSLSQTGEVVYRALQTGEGVKDYADGTKNAYVLSVPAGATGNPSETSSTVVSIPTSDKNYYYQFAMSGNVNLYFRRQPKAYASELRWSQMAVESIQQTTMPTPSADYEGKVYQYTGTTTNKYKMGVWYVCREQGYFAWLGQSDSKTYYTQSATPIKYAKIYDSNMLPIATKVDNVSGNTLTAINGTKYTRNSQNDKTVYEWQPLQDYTTTQDLLNLVYPVGSIYTCTHNMNPAEFLGGTWSIIGTNRVLWGVAETTGAGGTLSEQLPDIRGHIDWKDGGQAKTEISNGSGAFNLTNKNLGAAYPTGTGASNSARGFDFRASYYTDVYKSGASVRPNAYTVHFWRRTA